LSVKVLLIVDFVDKGEQEVRDLEMGDLRWDEKS
jgi:hypothetical protein